MYNNNLRLGNVSEDDGYFYNKSPVKTICCQSSLEVELVLSAAAFQWSVVETKIKPISYQTVYSANLKLK